METHKTPLKTKSEQRGMGNTGSTFQILRAVQMYSERWYKLAEVTLMCPKLEAEAIQKNYPFKNKSFRNVF